MLHFVDSRRVGWMLLVSNALLVATVAVLKHAEGDDPAQTQSSTGSAGAPTTPVDKPLDVDKPQDTADRSPQASATPLATPPLPNAVADKDPILDELRKLIRDPNGGLDLAPIAVPPPVPSGAMPQPRTSASHDFPTQPEADASAGKQWTRLQLRVESVHSLSHAAHKLIVEARASAADGRASEAEALMQEVVQLHAIIGRLTAQGLARHKEAEPGSY